MISDTQKRRESFTLVILALALAVVILVSKFVLGINFSLMENGGYVSFGYHEIRSNRIWALSFESFSGTVSARAEFPENAGRRLRVYAETDNADLELRVLSDGGEQVFTLDGTPLDLTVPGAGDSFEMILSGTDVLGGYFDAVWE